MTETTSSKTELARHKHAFECYYALGSRRSYRVVADEFQVSPSTIKNWSRDFKWRQRIEEREAERMRVVKESPGSDLLPLAQRLLTFVQGAKGSTMRDLAEGRTKPTGKLLCDILEERIALEPGFDENGAPPVNIIIVDSDK
jgi:transposase